MTLSQKVEQTLIATPVARNVHPLWHACMLNLTRRWHGAWEPAYHSSADVGANRRALVKLFLKHKRFNWLLFIDSDMAFPDGIIAEPDVLTRLHSWNVPMVGGIAVRRQAVPVPCASDLDENDKWVHLTSFPDDGLCQIDAPGLSCCLIARHVFEQVEQPWFVPIWNDGRVMGEDMAFCYRVHHAGIQAYGDVGMPLSHMEGSTCYNLPTWTEIYRMDEDVRKQYPKHNARPVESVAAAG